MSLVLTHRLHLHLLCINFLIHLVSCKRLQRVFHVKHIIGGDAEGRSWILCIQQGVDVYTSLFWSKNLLVGSQSLTLHLLLVRFLNSLIS